MDQNQTPSQPDYNFIMNQGSPTEPLPGQPKRRNKKVIVLIVLLIITALVMGLAVFLPNNQEKQQQSANEVVVENNEPRTNQEAVVRQFLAAIADQQYDDAYSKLASNAIMGEQTSVTKDWFTQFYIPATTQNWSFSPCTLYTPIESSPNTVESLCLSNDGQFTLVREYQIVENNGVYYIQSIKGAEVRQI